MKNLLFNKNVNLIFRLILGLVFIYASLDKISNPKVFSDLIDNFHISPLMLSNIAALILPWLELICGICLVTGYMVRGSNLLILFMLAFFIFILSQAVYRGIDTHCGCFKVDEVAQKTDFKYDLIKRIIEDIILLSMSFVLLIKSFNLSGLVKEE
tara:strand:+ start:114 stop:578 length:465 start_codon:yes stop_codon:yes gene_type:complete